MPLPHFSPYPPFSIPASIFILLSSPYPLRSTPALTRSSASAIPPLLPPQTFIPPLHHSNLTRATAPTVTPSPPSPLQTLPWAGCPILFSTPTLTPNPLPLHTPLPGSLTLLLAPPSGRDKDPLPPRPLHLSVVSLARFNNLVFDSLRPFLSFNSVFFFFVISVTLLASLLCGSLVHELVPFLFFSCIFS